METNPRFNTVNRHLNRGIYDLDGIWLRVNKNRAEKFAVDEIVSTVKTRASAEKEGKPLSLYDIAYRRLHHMDAAHMLTKLDLSHKLSDEQLSEFGHRNGRCIWCGEELNGARSKERGVHWVCSVHINVLDGRESGP